MPPNASYDTVAVCPVLMTAYRSFQRRIRQHVLVPTIVTASRDDLSIAATALKDEAFDLITKPIVPHEAIQSVRLALWQNRLLRLLASNEYAAERFNEHMKRFPHAVTMEREFETKMAAYDRTIRTLVTSMRQILKTEDEQSAFDLAVLVAEFTKRRAWDRLFDLREDGQSQ